MNLYMINMGGKVEGGNIEVHDVQFAIASDIENAIPMVKEKWYGIPEKLHLDSYLKMIGVDGYRITLTTTANQLPEKLYFVHLGGYKKASTQELHKVEFIVAKSEDEAKSKVKNQLGQFEVQGHIDHIVSIETCLLTHDGILYYIKLDETGETFDLSPDWFGYRRLDQ